MGRETRRRPVTAASHLQSAHPAISRRGLPLRSAAPRLSSTLRAGTVVRADPSPISQFGDALVTLSSAINTYREIRNATLGSRPARHSEPGPIINAPFSVRVLKVVGSGGPVYDWSANTTAATPNVTISASNTTSVLFTTKYKRTVKSFTPYTLRGVVELRNMQSHPVEVEVSSCLLCNQQQLLQQQQQQQQQQCHDFNMPHPNFPYPPPYQTNRAPCA